MKWFFYIVLVLSLFTVAACASFNTNQTSVKPAVNTKSDGLTAQKLNTGECGIFFWTSGQPRTFVFFQKQGEENARYYMQGTEIIAKTSQNTTDFGDGEIVLLDYDVAGFESFQIKGVFSEVLEGGRRISNATIKTKKPDAWQEIQPVSGVYVCR